MIKDGSGQVIEVDTPHQIRESIDNQEEELFGP